MPLRYLIDLLKLLQLLKVEAVSNFQIVCRGCNGLSEKTRKLGNNSEMCMTYNCPFLNKQLYTPTLQFFYLQRKGSLLSSAEYFEAQMDCVFGLITICYGVTVRATTPII